MDFDVQSVDLDTLADVASKGGIAALEELANGKQPELKTETPAEAEVTHTDAEQPPADPIPEAPAKTEAEKDHATAVSTKDGKGTIPYSVLKGARERASQFEQENAVLRRQIDELTNRMGSAPEPAAAAPVSVDDADAQIAAMQDKVAALKDDFPELAELYAGQMTLLQATRKQLVEVQSRYEAEQQQRAEAEQRRTADAVQEAIDANPTLVFWQQQAGPEWEAAVAADSMLRNRPEWADKTFAERFDRVVEMVKVMTPNAALPSAEPTSAQQKTQAAPAKRPPVNSLSDIPGGMPPAAGTREQIEDLSSAALGNKFMSMSPDQIQEYLASLAS